MGQGEEDGKWTILAFWHSTFRAHLWSGLFDKNDWKPRNKFFFAKSLKNFENSGWLGNFYKNSMSKPSLARLPPSNFAAELPIESAFAYHSIACVLEALNSFSSCDLIKLESDWISIDWISVFWNWNLTRLQFFKLQLIEYQYIWIGIWLKFNWFNFNVLKLESDWNLID